jgi:hypothetical protein
MLPRITDPTIWQKAELLMQPAFIRIIDNIRKQLDGSSWQGTYHDVLIWPPEITDQAKMHVTQLLHAMGTATSQQMEEIRATLTQLPIPHPGYHLQLQRQEHQVSLDLWDLCYQVCFVNYSRENSVVTVDASLVDELGNVDWHQLENKTKRLIQQVFDDLEQGTLNRES